MQEIGRSSPRQEKKGKRKLIPLPTYNGEQRRKERRGNRETEQLVDLNLEGHWLLVPLPSLSPDFTSSSSSETFGSKKTERQRDQRASFQHLHYCAPSTFLFNATASRLPRSAPRGITSQFFQRLTTVTVEGSTLEVRRSQNRLRDMTLKKQECHGSELVNGLDMFHDWNMLIYFTSHLKLGVTLI
ncbi:hypothetical protein K1719_040986 [Acacia pycnantha]|nr:hypothetical protein K1719_040986 [Acacia pycnantha]